jgi:hypothetical protein
LDTTIPNENPEALFSSKQRAGMVFSSMQRAVTDSLGAMRAQSATLWWKLVGHYWNLSWRLWVVTCDSIASPSVEILNRDGYVSRWTPRNVTPMCLYPKTLAFSSMFSYHDGHEAMWHKCVCAHVSVPLFFHHYGHDAMW